RARQAGDQQARVRAIIVYPMNALANSQLWELEKYLRSGYGPNNEPVTFARYTGQESQADRDRIRANPPDILLTNYVMLELMLTRPDDRKSLIRMARALSSWSSTRCTPTGGVRARMWRFSSGESRMPARQGACSASAPR